jgi:Domain of unknown function (DUF4185)
MPSHPADTDHSTTTKAAARGNQMNHQTAHFSDRNRPFNTWKSRIRISHLIAALVMFIPNFIVGCGSGGGGGGGESGVGVNPATREVPAANADVLISSVRDIGVIRVNPVILKRDAGFSALFRGKSVWLFGDTLLETANARNVTMMCNSWSTTYDTDAGDGIEGFSEEVDEVGAPLPLLPVTGEEEDFNARHGRKNCGEERCSVRWHMWPGTIVVDDSKQTAYVFYRKILVEPGLFRFRHVGHSIAVWKNYSESPERPVFNYYESYPTLFFAEEGDHGFGSAAVVVDKDVYIYGCELGEDELSKPCHLARVKLANILDKSKWFYYSGNSHWSQNSLESQEILHGNDMMSVFFSAYVNRFIAIYSEPLQATAMLRTAPRPEGPWSEPVEILSVDAPENIYGWVYDFLAHPEFSEDNGRIMYITYTKKTDQMHSELRLVAVELELSR